MLNSTDLIVWLLYLGHLNNKNQAHGVIETKYCVASLHSSLTAHQTWT